MELPPIAKNVAVEGRAHSEKRGESSLFRSARGMFGGRRDHERIPDLEEANSSEAPKEYHDQQQTVASLLEENARLRSKIARFEEEISSDSGDLEHALLMRREQHDERRAKVTNFPEEKQSPKIPSPSKRKRTKRRRWSFSSSQNRNSDIVEAVVRDDLDAHSSGRGLHHRRQVGAGAEYMDRIEKTQNAEAASDSALDRRMVRNSSDVFSDDMTEEDSLFSQPPGQLDRFNVDDGESIPTHSSFWPDLKDRASWLVGLMVLQSLSSFIIKRNEEVLEEHIIIVQFLTMLVGAGGNAGNQASVRVIRGLAVGSITDQNLREYLWQEFRAGLILSAILGVSGCVRAAVFATPIPETMAITTSLVAIVMISIAIGSLLPVGMKYVGIDPAHSSTSIQVIMDILGVTITVHVSKLFVGLAYKWLGA